MNNIFAAQRRDDPLFTPRLPALNEQQDAWRRQMELAQLANLAHLPPHPAPPPGAVPAASASRVMPQSERTRPEQPARPSPADAAATATDNAAPTTAALAVDQQPTRTAGFAARDAAKRHPTVSSVPKVPAEENPFNAAVVSAPTHATSPGCRPTTAGLAPPLEVVPNGTAAAAAPVRAIPLSLAFVDRAGTPDAESAACEPLPSSTTAQQRTTDAIWQKNLMHLLTDGGSVDVWIRDAALAGADVAAIVSRLGRELGAAGLQLRSVRVNGKLSYEIAPPTAEWIHPATDAAEQEVSNAA